MKHDAHQDVDAGIGPRRDLYRERLAQLVQRVEPVALARERVLPVAAPLQALLAHTSPHTSAEAGLIRGSVVSCQGVAAMSVALALVAEASAAGSWVAAVGTGSLGLGAASEVGVALERLVLVAEPAGQREMPWATMMSALIDGFDLVVVGGTQSVLHRLRSGTARRLHARVQARGAVLLVVGTSELLTPDVTITGVSAGWEGLGNGVGRLQRRRLTLSAAGRRLPRPRQLDVWLPGGCGRVEALGPVGTATGNPVGSPVDEATASIDYRQTG